MPPMRRSVQPTAAGLRAMQSLTSRVFPDAGWHHAGDLAWAATCQNAGDKSPAAIWTAAEDADSPVVAWGWLETPDELLLQVDPAYPDLADEVLAWAEQSAEGDLSVTISGDEPHLASALVARGYAPAADGPFFSCLSHDLADVPPAALLPDGYVIRSQVDAADVARRAAVHRAVWDSTLITADRHAAMREVWPYRGEFDLMAVHVATGEAVAYCQGWLDEVSGVGLFEPVGTRSDHRRFGLSRALGIAVLRAFAAAGARQATVFPRGDADYPIPKLVYESMGFAVYNRTYKYTRFGGYDR